MSKLLHIFNIQNEFKSLIIIGDLHGHWEVIAQNIINYDIKETCFYQVGDFGVGLVENQEPKLMELNDLLKQTKNVLYVNRGNHDDPKFFVEENLERYSHLKFLPDFTLLDIQMLDINGNLNQKRIFNIGGAVSTDRSKRTIGKDLFEKEEVQFNLIPEEFYQERKYIDVVISHTAPWFVKPFLTPLTMIGESILQSDPTLVECIENERMELGNIMTHEMLKNPFIDKVRCFYGHFHFSSTMESNGIDYSLLNINEFKEVNF